MNHYMHRLGIVAYTESTITTATAAVGYLVSYTNKINWHDNSSAFAVSLELSLQKQNSLLDRMMYDPEFCLSREMPCYERGGK